jgi:hypothetical protein
MMLLLFSNLKDSSNFNFGQGHFCHHVSHCISIGDSWIWCFNYVISHNRLKLGIFYLMEVVDGIFS